MKTPDTSDESDSEPVRSRKARLGDLGNKVRLGLLLLFTVCVPGIGLLLDVRLPGKSAEPAWKGKPLGSWIKRFDPMTGDYEPAAIEAIHAIGTNGVPWLLVWISQTNSWWEEKVDFDFTMERRWRLGLFTTEEKGYAATMAMGLLGEAAAFVTPELVQRLGNKPGDWSFAALEQIGTFAVPALIDGLSHTNGRVSRQSIWILGKIGPAASNSAPMIIAVAKDGSHRHRATAVIALGELKQADSEVVDVLIERTGDRDQEVSAYAIEALGKLGPGAHRAIPVLLSHATNTLGKVRNKTWKSIRAIDPTNPVPAEFR